MRFLILVAGLACGAAFGFLLVSPMGKSMLHDAVNVAHVSLLGQAAGSTDATVSRSASAESVSVASEVDGAAASLDRSGFEFWPPRLDHTYPDLKLYDQNGKLIQLSRLAGKPILIELVAIPCKGCQAFAGGNDKGGFQGVSVQQSLDSIHDYAKTYGKVELGRDITFVQLLLYANDLRAPTADDTAGWAKHFGMDARKRQLVLRGTNEMIGPQTYALIPGFHLIDGDFVLRYDSSGHQPRHNLYTELLPAISSLDQH